MTAVAVLGNLLFVVWQLVPINPSPLLNLRFLQDRGLFSAAVLGIVLGMLLGGSLYVVPQYLRRVESHSATQTGLLMSLSGVTSIGVLLLTPTLARMIGKLGGKSVMMIALAAQMISMGMLGHLLTGDTPDRDLWIPLLLNGIFVGIAVPTLALAAFARMAEHHSSSARAIYYGARQLGASLGVTLAVLLIDRRAAFHSSRLIDSLFSRNLTTLGVTRDPQTAVRRTHAGRCGAEAKPGADLCGCLLRDGRSGRRHAALSSSPSIAQRSATAARSQDRSRPQQVTCPR